MMASSLYGEAPAGFVTAAAAAATLGVSKRTLQNMVARMGIEVYRDPRDARVKLLKVEDVERLRQPIHEVRKGTR